MSNPPATHPTTDEKVADNAPLTVTVDLDAITANVAALSDLAASAGEGVMAVVKADAYGHGLVPAARAARAGGARWLGTAQLAESIALREAGDVGRLLAWLYVPGADFAGAIERGIDIGVSTDWALTEVLTAARRVGTAPRVHVKADTGLARNGAFGADLPALLQATIEAERAGTLRLVGLFSHFILADSPDHPSVREQQGRFEDAIALAEGLGAELEVRHLANSAATLTNPSAHYDLVRPGLAIYGLSPIPDIATSEQLGLIPAMTVTARLANVKRVPAGQGVSYGHAYVTDRETVLGLVPAGYADGIPRSAGNSGPVSIGQGGDRQLHTVAGRVCMDQFVVDLGPESTARAGDQVVLVGADPTGPDAQGWASAAGTISYEIVTRMAPRSTRRYLGGPAS